MTEDELQQIAKDFREAPQRALDARDAGIRRAQDEGWGVMDISRATGFSRETVRLALNPDAREAVRQAQAQRRADKDKP